MKKLALVAEGANPRTRAPRVELIAVMDQLYYALERGNRVSTAVGVVLGGLIPVVSYTLCHQGLRPGDLPLQTAAILALVAGGLLFSAKTVYAWCRQAFQDRAKALGFVVLTEGAMLQGRVAWVGLATLALLVAVNGVATGCHLALARRRR